MLGAGTVINPIIKIVTTVAILAAIGIFIVKPILETTEKAVDAAAEGSRGLNESISQTAQEAQIGAAKTRAKGYVSGLASGWPAAAAAVRECIKDAGDDLQDLNFCVNLGNRLVTRVQSNRNFALSYADSLSASGNTDAAQQVEDCVKEAGFETAAMRRCRNLADELLFG